MEKKQTMRENKIILKINAGSYLYGTNTPSSDRDYLGVYLNTKEELQYLPSLYSNFHLFIASNNSPYV